MMGLFTSPFSQFFINIYIYEDLETVILLKYRFFKAANINQFSDHPQPVLYGPDIRLHLPELHGISRLDVLFHALDLIQG
jgi:hypothetical protein